MSKEKVTNFSVPHLNCTNICIELRLKSHYALVGEKMKNEPLDDDGYAKSESGKSTRSVSKINSISKERNFQRKLFWINRFFKISSKCSASTSSGITNASSVDFIESFRSIMTRQRLKKTNEEISKPGR